MKKEDQAAPEKTEEPEDVSAWKNIGKTVFLIAVLVAAWFVLEWIMKK